MNSAVTNRGPMDRSNIFEGVAARLRLVPFALAIALLASMATAQVTGSGTTDFVPLWTGTTTVGNSLIFQTGGKVGIGTKTPSAKLDVKSTGTSQSALAVTSNYPTGSALVVENSGTAGSGSVATGIFSETTSATGFGNGVAGFTAGTTGSAGVVGTATSTTTDSVFGVVGTARLGDIVHAMGAQLALSRDLEKSAAHLWNSLRILL